jgi:DNA-binding PadR family transcriptional regulator
MHYSMPLAYEVEYMDETKITRDLGSKREKILLHLAENPKQFVQIIQKEIGYPDTQYGSVYKSVHELEKMGYLQSIKGATKKGETDYFSCTDIGVYHALAKNPDANIPKILENYKDDIELMGFFYKERQRMDHDLFDKLYRMVIKSATIAEKHPDQAIPSFFSQVLSFEKDLTQEERIKVLNKMLEYFPDTKKQVKEALANIRMLFSNLNLEDEE